MAMRFATKYRGISGPASAGQSFAHGLGTTPDEYWFVKIGGTDVGFVHASQPDSANVYISAAAGGGTASVFASVVHTYVK